MDKGIASSSVLTFLCFLSLLFAFSNARNPFMFELDQVNHDPLLSLYVKNLVQDDPNSILIQPEPELKPPTVIHLEPQPETINPKTTEPEPVPVTEIHLEPESEPEPETVNSKITEPKPETVYSTEVPKETSKASSDPNGAFTTFSFRSIDPNRIPRRPLPLSFRLRHRCHHHQRRNHHYKPWKPISRLPRRETPRLNDEKVDSVKLDKEFDQVTAAREVPTERMSLHKAEGRLTNERNLALERNALWRKLYHPHHRDHRDQRQHEPEKKNVSVQLMKSIRKFLNPF